MMSLLVLAAFAVYLCAVWAWVAHGWKRRWLLALGGGIATIAASYTAGINGPWPYFLAMLVAGAVMLLIWALLRPHRFLGANDRRRDQRTARAGTCTHRNSLQRRIGASAEQPLCDQRVLPGD